VLPEEGRARLAGLGFGAADVETLFAHFDDAERRGKLGHGHARIEWLETQAPDPAVRAERVEATDGFERWEAHGALGYLVLAEICAALVADPPERARVVVADAFPTGHLGYWARWLAGAGLVAALTATSPARLPHPDGGAPLVGTNPLAIGLPDGGGEPIVADVSMGAVTYGDVIRGAARPEELVPFGGAQAHKAFALALGLEGLVTSFVGDRHGIVLLAARPQHEFAARLRERAGGLRLPGDA
jgi:LDH2 family malate/lactate/ureidoglycolate dehydrogenase